MPLEPGQTLSHYRIAAKIGEGGMGAVYRAEDTKLERTVALKVLPDEMAADPDRLGRFQREARTVAALNHPHIVTLHSVEEDGGTHFLTMELVEGESLDRSLPGGGLPLRKVFDVGIALADALAAAHDRGIVHRDLKPANVMLTADGRVKVLDFGLAKLVDGRPPGAPPAEPRETAEENTQAATRAATLTDAGTVMGTVPYMSPEQLRGEAVDHRSDIFSLGSMLHEMATGRRAFQGQSSADLISSIVRDTPPAVTELRDDLPRHLARIIAHCLQKDPEERFQSAKDVRNELKELRREIDSGASVMTSAVSAPAARAVPSTPRRLPWPALVVTGLAVVAAALFWILRPDGEAGPAGGPEPAAAVQLRTSVAVLGFKNLAGREDKAWLSTALSEMLTTELGAGGELRTLPGETIAEMKRELSLQEGETYSPETLASMRELLGSDFVVSGSYLAVGEGETGQLRLDLRLQDTELGETVNTLSETGPEADLLGLISRTGARLREELGAAATTAEQRAALRAILPARPEAARAYTEGLDLLRQLDTQAARERLEEAAALEPDHPMIRWALAQAWNGLGYRARAIEEAERAFQHSGDLPEKQRLEVEGLLRSVQGDWPKAIEVFGAAWEAAPDDLDAGLRLAGVQSAGGKGEEALATLAALRRLPGGLGEDPRINTSESGALQGLGRYEKAAAAAAAAVKEARARGARFLEASALGAQAVALQWWGHNEKALPLAKAQLAIYREAGHAAGQAGALNILSLIHQSMNEPDAAIEVLLEAGEIHHATGNRMGEAVVFNNLANNYFRTGDIRRQREMYEESVGIQREIGSPPRELCVGVWNLAVTEYALGNLQAARSLLEESGELARQVEGRDLQSLVLLSLGWDRFLGGDLAAARADVEQALEIADEVGSLDFAGRARSSLRWLDWHRDDLTAFRAAEDTLRSLFEQQGIQGGLPDLDATAALLALEEGEPARAVRLAEQARTKFRDMENRWFLPISTALLARTLAAAGREEDAERELRAAEEAGRETQDVWMRLNAELTMAHAERSLGRVDDARRRLQGQMPRARELEYLPWQIEARLILASLDLRSGDPAAGRAALRALEEEARSAGFLYLARKAAEAAASS